MTTPTHISTFTTEVQALGTIIDQMTAHGWKPDIIIGLSRGGLIPAVWMSHTLNVPVLPVVWSTRDFPMKDADIILKQLRTQYKRKVLFVDDICDSGVTFGELQELVRPLGHDVRFASLFRRYNSSFTPTYVGMNVADDHWLDFSWELIGQSIRPMYTQRLAESA